MKIKFQARVVGKVDNAIHWIDHYLADILTWLALLTLIHWILIHRVDSVIRPLDNWGQNCKKTDMM